MQITHKGNTYEWKKEVGEKTIYLFSGKPMATIDDLIMNGVLELITKPCDHKNANILYGPDLWCCSKCGSHKYEIKPEDGISWLSYKKPDHDKAMDEVHGVEEEIPEVPEWDVRLYEWQEEKDEQKNFNDTQYQIARITLSLNLLIKAHNNK